MTADAVGGVWSYCVDLAHALTALGFETHIAVMGPSPSPEQRAQAAAIPVYEAGFALEWMDEPWADVDAAGDWLLHLEGEIRPDVIHLNGYSHAAVPFSHPKLVVAHSCVCSWWRAVHGQPAPQQWKEYHRRVLAGLAAANEIVAVSSAMGQALREEYGISPHRVIYNATSHDIGMEDNLKGDSLKRETAMFCAGRFWDEAKNLKAVEQAAHSIEAEIFAAGEGWTSDRIWLLGRLSKAEMRNWYRKCAVFCHPALYEPFGLAPLEAGLSGCALVLGDIPSLREIWEGHALFVDPRDPEQLACKVNSLLNNPQQRNEMGIAARRRASTFTLSRQARAYADAYGSLSN